MKTTKQGPSPSEILRAIYPHGLRPEQYDEALRSLEVVLKLAGKVEIGVPPPDRPLSRGAQRLITALKQKPGQTIEELAKKFDYNRTYVYALVTEIRRKGINVVGHASTDDGHHRYKLA